ncbi:hypothetical protein KFE80_08860 [bacterium SCSIO 12696]|nr:hypothetical protein KFE80_08860 [bacterium SCSIO 12696]
MPVPYQGVYTFDMRIFQSIKRQLSGRQKPDVYLGDLAVVPRSAFIKFLELNYNAKENTDEHLRELILSYISLPSLDAEKEAPDNAIRFDVLVANYTYGSPVALFSNPPLPVIWRPKIRVCFRLVQIRDSHVLAKFESKQYMRWREFLSKIFTLRYIFGFSPAISSEDLQRLLALALLEGLEWARKRV